MVNREKRVLAANLIRRFLEGQITNDWFANNYPSGVKDDAAIGAIYKRLWFFWDDLHEHKVEGKRQLSPEGRALFNRCIAFLDSDLEYEWPAIKFTSFSQVFLRAIGLRKLADKRADNWTERMNQLGAWDAWPFMREADQNIFRRQSLPVKPE
jgi:hypothetical protein